MNRYKTMSAIVISTAAVLITLILCIGSGSVFIPPADIIKSISNAVFGTGYDVAENTQNIIISVRIPRVLLAFFTGASLSVSGAAVQSVLCNPLASPFTLGTSSGASLGACIIFAAEITIFGNLTSTIFGLTAAVITTFAMIAFTRKLDGNLQSSTVVLTGMVLSLFINAFVTLIANIADEKYKLIMKWQTGSFSGRGWEAPLYLLAALIICMTIFILCAKQLDLLTFGDEQAQSVGLDSKKSKAMLIITASLLAGTAVSFAGVIGFVDLIAPHIARKLFGVRHKILIPMSTIIGGIFLSFCDLFARIVITPNELPVGVVTSLMGAPFFAYVFFRRRSAKK